MSSDAVRRVGALARRGFWPTVAVLALARMTVVMARGLENARGDFYATLPGTFVRAVNPTLWNSPDLANSWAFQRDVYLYGPTQYLTLFPLLAWADSFAAIARVLLVAYAAVIGLTIYLLWRSVQALQPCPPRLAVALVAAASLYFPLHVAYLQREFSVVVLCLTAGALLMLLRRREGVAAGILAYTAWFKFLPLAWLPYFVARRWWGAVASVAGVSAAVVVVSLVTLGPTAFGEAREVAQRQLGRRISGAGLCDEWIHPATRIPAVYNATFVDAGWALCSLADRLPWLPAPQLYAALLLALAALFLAGLWRLERGGPLSQADESWRRALEAGLVVMAVSTLVHAHYYYLSALILPLGLLLARYLAPGHERPVRLALWLAAYLSLAAFALPISVWSWLLGLDFWSAYMRHTLYFPGQLLLFGLLFWEYLTVPVGPRAAAA